MCLLHIVEVVVATNSSTHSDILSNKQQQQQQHSFFQYFPVDIPIFHVRRDIHTGEEVTRGRLHLIHENPSLETYTGPRVSFEEFRRSLQCDPLEPDIEGRHGGLSMLQLVKLSRDSLEMAAAWAETNCKPWPECRPHVTSFKAGEFPFKTIEYEGANIQILRIIRGELYGDWPWGYERQGNKWTTSGIGVGGALSLFVRVVRTISDWRDNVFFVGGESASLPFQFPFPIISEGAKLGYNDIPRPWNRAFVAQVERYQEALEKKNFADDSYLRHGKSHLMPWEKRLSKAAFFATISLENIYRTIVLDQAASRPDIFDAGFGNPWGKLCSWNPLAVESCVHVNESYLPHSAHPQPGDIDNIWSIHGERHSNLGMYKYLVVTLGGIGAPSDRLENMIAYSGSVILLQESDWSYHFSSKLKPWVHYVPISYSTSDLTDKVDWLIANDHLAQRIAQNAANFGKSHLRLEDSYCYLAAAIKSVENVVSNTSAAKMPWKPWKFHVHKDEHP